MASLYLYIYIYKVKRGQVYLPTEKLNGLRFSIGKLKSQKVSIAPENLYKVRESL